jgi:CheY-like chemotaxis protein
MSSAAGDTFTDVAKANGPSVLVACDDRLLGQGLEALLAGDGYHSLRVNSGESLLERLRGDGRPCVVLLSLRWRPLNSQAILEAVAADAVLAFRHAFVLVTALWDMLPSDYSALVTRLAVPVVPKPFQMEEVLDAVAEAAAQLER